MNRKNLTSAVLAGLAGAAGIASTAQAVNLNPDGIGQVLIYPYYTVNANEEGNVNTTLLSVVNTSENAKAVKVRFNEGQNSQEVLDFNLYLSPYDVWVASVRNIDNVPSLFTEDTSCTVPNFRDTTFFPDFETTGVAFQVFQLDDKGTPEEYDPIFPRGAEGHFEIIEMGTLNDLEKGSASAATHEILTTDEVLAGGVAEPTDCEQLNDAWFSGDTDRDNYWTTGTEETDPGLVDIDPPSGGLFGGASIVNVQTGYMFSYDAKAINGWNDSRFDLSGDVVLHQKPGSELPSLDSGNQTVATVFLDNGATLVSGSFTRAVDAVSFVFMHDQVMNEYITDNRINAETEWVMTFPTKKWYTWDQLVGPFPLAPFTELWSLSVDTDGDEDPDEWGACEIVVLDGLYDREEQVFNQPGEEIPPIVSPSPPDVDPERPVFELCYETSVIEFKGVAADDGGVEVEDGDQSRLLGSFNFHVVDNGAIGFQNGWLRLEMDDYEFDGDDVLSSRDPLIAVGGDGLEGLPITGFSAKKFGNFSLGSGGDVLANYGGIYQHKGTRKAASSMDVAAR